MPKFVLSCDVAKGKSTFGLFEFEDGSLKTIKRPRNYEHNLDGLMAMYNDFELKDREDVLVMMESTLVYQTPLVVFFKSHGLENVVVENPLLIARKSFGLTKTKTDNLDCFRIEIYRFPAQSGDGCSEQDTSLFSGGLSGNRENSWEISVFGGFFKPSEDLSASPNDQPEDNRWDCHGNGRKYQKVRFLSGTRP